MSSLLAAGVTVSLILCWCVWGWIEVAWFYALPCFTSKFEMIPTGIIGASLSGRWVRPTSSSALWGGSVRTGILGCFELHQIWTCRDKFSIPCSSSVNMSGMIVSVVDSMSLFSIFMRCNDFFRCFFKKWELFLFLCPVACSHQSEGHQFVEVMCNLVISVDMRPYFTGIALYIISSTNTTQTFTIA